MKMSVKTFIMLLTTAFLFQSCSKTYEIQFDKLSMLAFKRNFQTPEYLENCRMEVVTSAEFDVKHYIETASNFSNFSYGFDFDDTYHYMTEWDKTESGFFYLPNMKNWDITLYDNTTGEKVFEVSCSNGVVKSLSVWEYGNLICEAKGSISCYDEVYENYLSLGNLKIYGYDGKRYIKKEENIECLEKTAEYRKLKHTTSENYSTGQAYHVTSEIYTDDDSFYEIVEDSYYNEDGSDMTKFDRLTKGHNKYILFETNLTSSGYPVYTVMIPESGSYESGHIIAFLSDSDLNSIVMMKNFFTYNVNGDVLECFDFHGYAMLIPKKSNRDIRFFMDLKEYDDNIMLVARTPNNHFYEGAKFYVSEKPYNSALYEFLKKKLGWKIIFPNSDSIEDSSFEEEGNNRPSWLMGSWRTPLDEGGVLIVNLYSNDAYVKIMNGFSLVSEIKYDSWAVLDNMLYLANDGEKVKDSPSFYIDFNNRTIIGHGGERFQKH